MHEAKFNTLRSPISKNFTETQTGQYVVDSNNLFSHNSAAFVVSCGIVCGVIVCIIATGVVLERKRTGGVSRFMCCREMEGGGEGDGKEDGSSLKVYEG